MKLWTEPGRIFTNEPFECHCVDGAVDIRLEHDEKVCSVSLTFKDIMIGADITSLVDDIRKNKYLRVKKDVNGYLASEVNGQMFFLDIPVTVIIARDNCNSIELTAKTITIHAPASPICKHIRKYPRA